MTNRREFLAQILVAGSLSGSAAALASSNEAPSLTSKPLRILILGGTGHIGPFHVRAAVARGHQVAFFSRGGEYVNLPASVARLIGDRNGNLDSIRHREWDAVLDLAAYGPGWV